MMTKEQHWKNAEERANQMFMLIGEEKDGYHVISIETKKQYFVFADENYVYGCTCPHSQYRECNCKHAQFVADKLGLEVSKDLLLE